MADDNAIGELAASDRYEPDRAYLLDTLARWGLQPETAAVPAGGGEFPPSTDPFERAAERVRRSVPVAEKPPGYERGMGALAEIVGLGLPGERAVSGLYQLAKTAPRAAAALGLTAGTAATPAMIGPAQRSFEQSERLRQFGDYDPASVVAATLYGLSPQGAATAAKQTPTSSLGAFGSRPFAMGELAASDLVHGISVNKLPRPISEMSSGRLLLERPAEQRLISPEQLQGGILLPTLGDRSAVGGLLTNVGETRLAQPVPLQGGYGFMAENVGRGDVWASEKAKISTLANRAARLAEQENVPVYLPYTAMGERSVDFSHHMSDTLADMLANSARIRRARPGEEAPAAMFDSIMRDQTWNKSKPVADWPGVRSSDLKDYLIGAPGDVRNKFAKLMDSARFQEAGFPSVAEARFAVTDPRLLHEPTGAAGLAIARVDPSIIRPAAHRTYSTAIGGEYLGGFGRSIPKEVMYPDILAAYKAQGYGPERYDYLMRQGMAPVYQRADQRWLDNIMKYLQSR